MSGGFSDAIIDQLIEAMRRPGPFSVALGGKAPGIPRVVPNEADVVEFTIPGGTTVDKYWVFDRRGGQIGMFGLPWPEVFAKQGRFVMTLAFNVNGRLVRPGDLYDPADTVWPWTPPGAEPATKLPEAPPGPRGPIRVGPTRAIEAGP